ncbi:MAG: hypothetical protein KatS3mg019_2117 [Fimbriimonadales bacterium]|nr:MAG: hypothetical protein KatS3mg019_2117 [Fimbriimonadales bacterium]
MKKFYLYTDGSSLGNPGSAGIAYLLLSEAGEIIDRGQEAIGNATNNQAEYRALLKGLEAARAAGAQQLEWFSDSELLVKQWTGAYKIRDSHLRQLMRRAKALAQGVEVIPHAAPRNSLPEMAHVDALAREAAMAHASQSRKASR